MLYQTANPHGGDLFGHAVDLDFSVNTNPLGTPEPVMRAVVESAGRLCQYPDPRCRELTEAIAAREGVPVEAVLCGCGAAELIYAYCGVIGKGSALLAAPTFSEYEAALGAAGLEAVHFFLREEDGFAVTADFLEELRQTACHTVFLCNPNNPTGILIEPGILAEICRICRQRGIRLFLDECFLELSGGGREATLAGMLPDFPGLFILKAFTKSYGMAGLRLGYCLCGEEKLLSAMSRRAQPWNVSLPAQSAGVAALKEASFLEQARALIQRERPKMAEGLEKLGFSVYPSQGNYLLFKSSVPLFQPLLERGILIRDCGNYVGLGDGFYRVAVKRPQENQRLLEAMREVASSRESPACKNGLSSR